jgi:hypothetical protein
MPSIWAVLFVVALVIFNYLTKDNGVGSAPRRRYKDGIDPLTRHFLRK